MQLRSLASTVVLMDEVMVPMRPNPLITLETLTVRGFRGLRGLFDRGDRLFLLEEDMDR